MSIRVRFKKTFPNLRIEGEFEFPVGINVILGHSGCGKTTTLRVMCGLEMAEEGFMECCEEVFFDTKRRVFLPPQKRRIGVVFQEDNLLPHLSVEENIRFAIRDEEDSLEDMLKKFNLYHIKDKRPDQISGGERQRVAIVRALAYRPRALLMDEPFSSLDFAIKLEIMDFIKILDLNMPVVMVTHDPIEAFYLADRVFIMERGRKIREGGKEIIKDHFSGMESLIRDYMSS